MIAYPNEAEIFDRDKAAWQNSQLWSSHPRASLGLHAWERGGHGFKVIQGSEL